MVLIGRYGLNQYYGLTCAAVTLMQVLRCAAATARGIGRHRPKGTVSREPIQAWLVPLHPPVITYTRTQAIPIHKHTGIYSLTCSHQSHSHCHRLCLAGWHLKHLRG